MFEVLARSHVWVPLPAGGGPDSVGLDLPTIELAGALYVPVFSSQEQFLRGAGPMAGTVAPVREFAAVFGQPLRAGIQLAGGRFLRSYPYQEAYLLDRATR